MKKKSIGLILALFLSLLVPSMVTAQAKDLMYDHRVLGDRAFSFQMGPMFPLLFQQFNGSTAPTRLSVGGTLGINLDFYLNDSFRLGGGLKGMAAFTPNNFTLFMVPVTFRSIWEFKTFPFSFPVGLGAGLCFTTFRQAMNVDPILIPTAGMQWNINSSWSFGLDASYWWDFQLYPGSPLPFTESRMGHFLDFTLGAVYHF